MPVEFASDESNALDGIFDRMRIVANNIVYFIATIHADDLPALHNDDE